MILLDTGGLFAFLDRSDRMHDAAARVVAEDDGPFILSPFVLAELDDFVLDRLGVAAELALLADVAEGRYELVAMTAADVAAARSVAATYHDLAIGLSDASIVVLADRYAVNRVLTLDERHLRALRMSDGRPFVLLPADA